jgi:hypothetical protein
MVVRLQSLDLWLFEVLTPLHWPWLDAAMTTVGFSGTASDIWLLGDTGRSGMTDDAGGSVAAGAHPVDLLRHRY